MGEAINLVKNFKVEQVVFSVGDYNYLEEDLIKVLNSVLENHNIIKEYSTNSFKKINKYIKENNFEKELKNIL